MLSTYVFAALLLALSASCRDELDDIYPDSGPSWTDLYGAPTDAAFSGIVTFAHLPHERCLASGHWKPLFDIGIIGFPFDTTVTYRPGARFGPHGIRSGSRRLRVEAGWTPEWGTNPYSGSYNIVDCGDVPINPFDNGLALDQMEVAYNTLISRPVGNFDLRRTRGLAKDGIERPRLITLGGDHTIVLPILRALARVYGPITVLHFDSHIDTWAPRKSFGLNTTEQAKITHGTFFWKAFEEGLISDRSVHAGIRCKFEGEQDLKHDEQVGFQLIHTDEIDEIGTDGIIRKIRERVGDTPLYLSLDIDVLDPAFAPATGTPEPGGWSTRELKRILRGLEGLNFVGADIVEVAPVYDTNAETTTIAAAHIVHEFLSLFISQPTVPANRARDEL